jgi:hypothetical protein
MYINVYHSTALNRPKAETIQVSINAGVDTLRYIHTMKYYSALESNEVLNYGTAWMNLENIMLK